MARETLVSNILTGNNIFGSKSNSECMGNTADQYTGRSAYRMILEGYDIGNCGSSPDSLGEVEEGKIEMKQHLKTRTRKGEGLDSLHLAERRCRNLLTGFT